MKLSFISIFLFTIMVFPWHLSAQTYTIQATPSPSAGGTISDWNGTSYNIRISSSSYVGANSSIYLLATPSKGYFFTGWSGDITSSLNPLSFYANSNINTSANFSPLNLPISIAPDATTQFYLESISSFTAASENISSLSGIQYAKNLNKLIIHHNSLTDLSPLWNLSSLTDLDLSGGYSILSFDGIENLKELKNVYAEGHKISSITPFTSLPKLYHLKLQKNFLNLADTSIQAEIAGLRNAGVYVEVDHQVPLVAQNLSSELSNNKQNIFSNQSNPLANFLYAVEILLNLFEKTETESLKYVARSLGISDSINNFIISDLWDKSLNFEKSINENFQYSEIENFFENEFLPTTEIANLYLSKINSYNTPITLTQDKTGLESPLYVDYADILVIKTITKTLNAIIKIFLSYDFSIQTSHVKKLHDTKLVSLESLFDSSPTFGSLKSKNLLAEAKEDLKEAISLYQTASYTFRNTSRMSYKYLFNLKTTDLDDEEKFRSDITNLNSALDYPYDLNDSKNDSNDIINLSRFFRSKLDLSSNLPPLVGNKFISSQVTDSTLGGLMPNWTPQILYSEMEESNLISKDVLEGINDIEDATNWKTSNWLGNFFIPNRTDNSKFWMYHQQLGWGYICSSSPNDIWIYIVGADRTIGNWVWTRKSVYPNLFRHNDNAWLYAMSDGSGFQKWENQKWTPEKL